MYAQQDVKYVDPQFIVLRPGWNLTKVNKVKRWFFYEDRRRHRCEQLDMLDVFINYCADLLDYMLFRQNAGDEEMAIPFLKYQQTLHSSIANDNRQSLSGRVKGTFMNWTQDPKALWLSINRASHDPTFKIFVHRDMDKYEDMPASIYSRIKVRTTDRGSDTKMYPKRKHQGFISKIAFLLSHSIVVALIPVFRQRSSSKHVITFIGAMSVISKVYDLCFTLLRQQMQKL